MHVDHKSYRNTKYITFQCFLANIMQLENEVFQSAMLPMFFVLHKPALNKREDNYANPKQEELLVYLCFKYTIVFLSLGP